MDHVRGSHRVAVLIQDGFIPFESGIPHRIFGRARDSQDRPLYEVITCTTDGPGPVQSDSDVVVLAPHGPEVLASADTVVIPKFGSDAATSVAGVLSAPLKEALDLIRPGTRIMSICTGAFALAAAGMLDGRPATTHWAHTDDFRELFPQVRLDPDVLFVDDGDILTSAGVAAGIDLCLHVVRRDHGVAVANRVARVTVVPPHRDGGQAQFIRHSAHVPGATGIPAAIAWTLDHLDRPLTLETMASQASMSVRTFTRRFREETGESPGRWLQRQRIELARNLLETTDLTIEQLVDRCGFNTAQSLRLHFHAALGVTPTAYRRTFRG